jgi:hypothetical protein
MESMVTDPNVTKVIVVSDKRYAEKADGRKGGVGTESQITSAEIYNKTDQTKFVAVISEVDDHGEPYLPRFFVSRVYILMTEAHFATNFEQLLRWIYDKPLYVKRALGNMPAFLREERPASPTRGKAMRAIEIIATEGAVRAPSVSGPSPSIDTYLASLVAALQDFYLDSTSPDFPQAVLDNIDAFLPYRNEFIEVMMAAAANSSLNIAKSLQRFFERIIPFMSRPENVTSWRSCDYDNFIFIVHELFLYAASILLKYERFETLNELIELRFYCPDLDRAGESMRPYTIIQNSMDSLQAKQQELRRISLRADLLKQRNQTSGLDFAELMAADFILFLRAPWLPEGYNRWYPETLIYSTFRFRKPLEVFARSESKAFFAKLVDRV